MPRRGESIESAAQRWELNPRTIRRMIARGQIIGYRVGGNKLLRVDPAEVDAAMTPVPTVGGAA
jgi:excisionase family DNA binding protein